MAFIRLRDMASGEEQDFHGSTVRVGRDPEFEIVPTGPVADVVSGRHLMLLHDQGRWWIEDLGSSNGTFLDDEPLIPGKRVGLVRGAVVRLGQAGPQFSIVNTAERRASPTLIEEGVQDEHVPFDSADAAGVTTPMAAMEAPAIGDDVLPPEFVVVLRNVKTGDRHEVRNQCVRIGRSRDNDVQLAREDDTSVSRNHAEILLYESGAVLRDLRSRNGSFVNAEKIAGDHLLHIGDQIQLGASGPVLELESLSIPGFDPIGANKRGIVDVEPDSPAALGSGWARRRKLGGKGRTALADVADDAPNQRSRGAQRLFWSAVAVIALGAAGFYGFTEMRAREAGPALETPDAATSPLAPEREESRAQSEIAAQLEAVDAIRRGGEDEVARLQAELDRAVKDSVSDGSLDSLRSAMQGAEVRSRELDDQARAIRGVDLGAVAQANQGAVGLVWAYTDGEVVYGSGFVLTPSGYFITTRNLVASNGRTADSVFVTMADRRQRLPAQIVRAPAEPDVDLAVLRIANYAGPFVSSVDWEGAGVRHGEPAAMIGFPGGLVTAVDEAVTFRTSISAGVFSTITQDRIQFDGITITGSSGSPIFNADGDVVAVHRAGRRDADGLSVAVPISLATALLPSDARRELGLTNRDQ